MKPLLGWQREEHGRRLWQVAQRSKEEVKLSSVEQRRKLEICLCRGEYRHSQEANRWRAKKSPNRRGEERGTQVPTKPLGKSGREWDSESGGSPRGS